MKFDYRACDREGRTQRGVLEADSLRHARDRLREKGWQVLAVQARGRFRFRRHVCRPLDERREQRRCGAVDPAAGDAALRCAAARGSVDGGGAANGEKGLQAALAQVRQRILEGFRWRRL